MAGERLGVLGGTFDPPHVGHLVAAVEVRHALELDRVLLVVANVPWQKAELRAVTPAGLRLAMVEALVDGVDGVEASDLEIRRGGDSFTVDTLRDLAEADPDGERFLVVGADAAAGLGSWERAGELPGLATLVLIDRPGLACPAPPAGFPVARIGIPRLDVSSSDLRRRVVEGRPVDGLVPRGVATLIERHNIYREAP
jgi:nicotinate-nucleotide adenylyltransferase